MNDIQGLAQRLAVHDERDIRFRSTLRTGYHIDTVASQRAEQLAGNTRRMLHILAYNGHRSQIFLRLYGRNLSHFNLFGKLLIQHLTSQVGIRIAHTDGSGVLRRGLRNEEHTDAVLCQSFEDAIVHTNHANHAKALEILQKAGYVG